MSTSLHKIFQIIVLFWTLGAHLVSATTYTYLINYGGGGYVCHASVSIYINSSNPTIRPEITLISVYCVAASGASGENYDIELNTPAGVNGYITSLGPATSRGDRGFEIGFNQARQTFPDGVVIPAMVPRVNLYTDPRAEPVGACSYRQGAIQFAQNNGRPLAPYSSCPAGSSLIGSIGRWLICNYGCDRF